MAVKKKPVEEITDKEIDDVIDADKQFGQVFEAPSAPLTATDAEAEKAAHDAHYGKMFKVRVPFALKIGGRDFDPGIHTVPRGTMEVITEMVYRKRTADIAVYTGRNHLVERLADRSLRVTEVDELFGKK